MKILFFHRWTGVHFGGTENHVTSLISLLSERGHDVSLLTRQGERGGFFDDRIKVYAVSKNPFESDHSYETQILLYFHTFLFMVKSFLFLVYLKVFRGQTFDVISVHFVTEALVARFFRFLFKTPYVFIQEGYTFLEANEAKNADKSVAISENMVQKILKVHGYQSVFLPVGIDLKRFNLQVDGSEERAKYITGFEKLIVTVGRIEPRKDYPTLVAAARLVKQKGYRYRFLIVGEGIDREKISHLIEEEELSREVLLLGALSEERKSKIYRASDLFVLPTLYEGFGIVFVEAMVCGLPIVSTNVGAVPEVVGQAGLLVEPKKAEDLAQAIIKVMNNPELYKDLKDNAFKLGSSYDWDRLIVEYENVYLSVVKK